MTRTAVRVVTCRRLSAHNMDARIDLAPAYTRVFRRPRWTRISTMLVALLVAAILLATAGYKAPRPEGNIDANAPLTVLQLDGLQRYSSDQEC